MLRNLNDMNVHEFGFRTLDGKNVFLQFMQMALIAFPEKD
jgi:hypothetical protein